MPDYKIIHDIETGEVQAIEEIRNASIVSTDKDLCDDIIEGRCRGTVVDGVLTRNDEVVRIAMNVVPSKETAEALGLQLNVGISAITLKVLAQDAGITLESREASAIEEAATINKD